MGRFIALLAAVVGVIALAVAGIYLYRHHHAAAPTAEDRRAAGESPAATPEPPKAQGDAKPATAAPAKPTAVPSFDVVRIEPSGEGVIAGRAEPGWAVRIESGTAIIAETTADDEGAWSVVLEKPLPSGDHSLSLRAVSPDGMRALTSQQSVQVAGAKAKGEAVAEAEPAKAPEPAKEAAAPAASNEPQIAAEAPKPEQQAEDSSLASQPQPVVPDENAPPPERAKPPVRIRNVEYQDSGPDSGKMSISGTGDPNLHVFFFFDEDPIGRVTIEADGTYSFEIEKKLPPGEHTIHADTFDEKTGMVAGRASVNIGREPEAAAPPVAAQAPAEPGQASSSPAPVEPAASPAAAPAAVATAEPGLASQPQPVYPDGGVPEPEVSAPALPPAEATGLPSLASQPQPVVPEEQPQAEVVAAPPAAPEPEATPAIAAAPAEQPAPRKLPPIVFKSVDYQDKSATSGKVALAGTGDPGARIVLFLDETPLGEVVVGADGSWAFETDKKVGTGEHSFHADRMDEATGIVIGRASVGIMRMEEPPAPAKAAQAATPAPTPAPPPPAAPPSPAAPQAAPGTAQAPAKSQPQIAAAEETKPAATGGKHVHRKRHRPRVYSVRRGDTLWEIAESYYGGGWHYRAIVKDNRRKIHNPNMIYPKQKFHIPAR